MRELESSLQQFGEFLLEARLVKERSAPFFVRYVRQFLVRPTTDAPLTDRVLQFCEDLERIGAQDWQVQQANQAIRIYFVNFLKRTDWHVTRSGALIDCDGRVDPLSFWKRCAPASAPATTRIAPSAATWTGSDACSTTRPSSRAPSGLASMGKRCATFSHTSR